MSTLSVKQEKPTVPDLFTGIFSVFSKLYSYSFTLHTQTWSIALNDLQPELSKIFSQAGLDAANFKGKVYPEGVEREVLSVASRTPDLSYDRRGQSFEFYCLSEDQADRHLANLPGGPDPYVRIADLLNRESQKAPRRDCPV